MKQIDIISPVFREEASIEAFHDALSRNLEGLKDRYVFTINYYVDPAADKTESILERIVAFDSRVRVSVMSRRFGHQAALIAGIDDSCGAAAIMLDSDLQHPSELIPEMLNLWEKGADIVQTLRTDGKETAQAKRTTSLWFYKILQKVSTIDLKPGAADYRLISRRVVERFQQDIREQNPFLRGLVTWVGFNITYLPFVPAKRFGGRSNYSVSRLFAFALNGVTSFSKLPLRVCISVGLIMAVLSILAGAVNIALYLFGNSSVPGWASLFALMAFTSGINLFFLGVLGEYVGHIFDEVKGRPRYLISHSYGRNQLGREAVTHVEAKLS